MACPYKTVYVCLCPQGEIQSVAFSFLHYASYSNWCKDIITSLLIAKHCKIDADPIFPNFVNTMSNVLKTFRNITKFCLITIGRRRRDCIIILLIFYPLLNTHAHNYLPMISGLQSTCRPATSTVVSHSFP